MAVARTNEQTNKKGGVAEKEKITWRLIGSKSLFQSSLACVLNSPALVLGGKRKNSMRFSPIHASYLILISFPERERFWWCVREERETHEGGHMLGCPYQWGGGENMREAAAAAAAGR